MAELEEEIYLLLEGYEYATGMEIEQDLAADQYDSDAEQRLVIASELEQHVMSKDRSIYWMLHPFWVNNDDDVDELSLNRAFFPNPTIYCISKIEGIKSVFRLFFDSSIMDIIIFNTNIEGRKVFGNEWTEVNEETLEAYIGLLILGGVFRSSGESLKRLWNAETGRNIFRAAMSLEVFVNISRALRFDSDPKSENIEADALGPIKEIWDKWVSLLPKCFSPGNDLTIGEETVEFEGTCPFQQETSPQKSEQNEMKLWTMRDSATSYVLKVKISTDETTEELPEKDETSNLVSKFTEGMKFRHITCDNNFISHQLGQLLLKRKLTLLGKIESWRTEFPAFDFDKELYSSNFYFTKDTTLVSYVQKKNKPTFLMSTKHTHGILSNREDKKPLMVMEYEDAKKAMKKSEQEILKFSCKRKSAIWVTALFYRMVDISAFNAYVLWKIVKQNQNKDKEKEKDNEKEEKVIKRRTFLEELGQALVLPYMASRANFPRDEEAISVLKNMQDRAALSSPSDNTPATITGVKRGRCKFCPRKSDNLTSTKCEKCKKYVCQEHISSVCQDCKK